MSEALYRAIVGAQVEPLRKIDEVPTPYRQTLPAPLAPLKGSVSDEPDEADIPPIIEQSEIS